MTGPVSGYIEMMYVYHFGLLTNGVDIPHSHKSVVLGRTTDLFAERGIP